MNTRWLFLILFVWSYIGPLKALDKVELASDITYESNVIFITLDGVRYEEFFSNYPDSKLSQGDNKPLMPYFWNELAPLGVVIGDVTKGQTMSISNHVGISYPAYLSMLNGEFTESCLSNDHVPECPRTTLETFPERLLREKVIAKNKVAVFSSWKRIEDAVESKQGSLVVNAGAIEFRDPMFPNAHNEINKRQRLLMGNSPTNVTERPDEITYAHAITYIKNHRPKFLYLYLGDSDTHAHHANYAQYIQDLRTYDKWLKQLMDILNEMGDYGKNTSIVITTDHGRGLDYLWPHHGPGLPADSFENSKKVWSFFYGPHTPMLGSVSHGPYAHINLRPTIEILLGLKPLKNKIPIKEAINF